MKVCVFGLWHLGSVTAACAASLGHDVAGFDPDDGVVRGLQAATPPIGEPGLPELVANQRDAGRLHFTTDLASALAGARVLWAVQDTPVDEDDRADVDFVMRSIASAFPYLENGSLVLVSSQLPVGSVRELERRYASLGTGRSVGFAYSPENLRLGKAIEVFLSPDRIVVGTRDAAHRPTIEELFGRLAGAIVWMSVESAEMTKHAVNGFLATSVTFMNEVARLCEAVGADAGEVERGLKSEARIGPKAYLGPGAAFGGGTLARDVQFLRAIGVRNQRVTPLLDGLADSNTRHRAWPIESIQQALPSIAGSRIAVWGLTYKAGTTTLRRSDAVSLCHDLLARGATVVAHDPTVKGPASELDSKVLVSHDPLDAASKADALVVATGWPAFREVPGDRLHAALKQPIVIDANRFLEATIGGDRRFRYFTVGRWSSGE